MNAFQTLFSPSMAEPMQHDHTQVIEAAKLQDIVEAVQAIGRSIQTMDERQHDNFERVNSQLDAMSTAQRSGLSLSRRESMSHQQQQQQQQQGMVDGMSPPHMAGWADAMYARYKPGNMNILVDDNNPAEKIELLLSTLLQGGKALERDKEACVRENEKLKGQNRAALLALEKSKEQIDKYRELMLKGAGDDGEPIDDEIKQKFLLLRSRVQAVAQEADLSRPMRGLQKAHRLDGDRSKEQGWRRVDDMREQLIDDIDAERSEQWCRFLIRGALFRVLHETVFDRPLFSPWFHINKSLGRFEKDIEQTMGQSTSGRADLNEWRSRTTKLAQRIPGPTGEQNHLPAELADMMRYLLEPLEQAKSKPMLRRTGSAQGGRMDDRLYDIAAQAYEMKLLMRRSKDEWAVVYIERGTPCFGDARDKAIAPEVMGAKVLVTMFGCLQKTTPRSDEPQILERAEVACH